jgi:hypothetical protein
MRDEKTQAFFRDFADPEFLVKPILKPELEDVYEGGTIDFEGKYALRHPPYLFEPTFDEDYVYGFAGGGA